MKMSDYDKDFVRVLLNNLEEAIFLLDKTTITFANEMAKSFGSIINIGVCKKEKI